MDVIKTLSISAPGSEKLEKESKMTIFQVFGSFSTFLRAY